MQFSCYFIFLHKLKLFKNILSRRHLDCYRIMLNMQEFSSIDIRCPYCRKLKIAIIKKLQAKSRINFKTDPSEICAKKNQLSRMRLILTHLETKVVTYK